MRKLLLKILLRIAPLPVVIWLFFFVPAGTTDFWQVYVFFGVILVPMSVALVYFLINDPELLERRLNMKESESEQRLIVTILVISVVAMYLIPGFDKRFGWSEIPTWLVLIADVFVLVGYSFMLYVSKVNSFASRVIEVEDEQTVIDTGPYKRVRHPMYVGALIMYLGTPPALGSWWAYLPMIVVPVLIVLRILNEEQVLRRGLSGYSDYCQRITWRLIPGIW